MSTVATALRLPPFAGAAGVSLRPLTPDDLAFSEEVYASTRSAEMALTGWPADQCAAFLRQQHQLQHAHYQTHYPDAAWLVIERRGEPIGRLYLADLADGIRIIDIALLPAARGAGIGEALLRHVGGWAASLGRPVSAHVEKGNPARRLYQRLGFAVVAEGDVYDLLEWRPA